MTAELEKARGTTPELAAVQRRLAHLERSSEERFATYERRLDSHRERERAQRDELDATRAALKTANQELERTQRKLERAEARLERLKPKKESVVTGVLSRPRIKRLEAELDAARKELARVQGCSGDRLADGEPTLGTLRTSLDLMHRPIVRAFGSAPRSQSRRRFSSQSRVDRRRSVEWLPRVHAPGGVAVAASSRVGVGDVTVSSGVGPEFSRRSGRRSIEQGGRRRRHRVERRWPRVLAPEWPSQHRAGGV